MTPSDQGAGKTRLRLKAVNMPAGREDYDTRLTVFSGHGVKVAQGRGTLSVDLPRGIYTVRTERFGEIGEDTVILHEYESDEPTTIAAPRRHSAMPSTDTSHTHEFLQGAAYQFSRNTTWKNPGATDDDPLLMILVRATGDGDHSGSRPASGLSLMNEEGGIVTSFEPDRVEGHGSKGWVVFSARQKSGNYILSDIRGGRAVSLPILLTRERWDTLVFVPFEGHPRLSAASVDMCRRKNGFDPEDTFTQYIDAAVQGLGMRLDLLPDRLRRGAIYGKFDHPFHGLIGAHAHFLGPQRNERLEAKMLRNLWRLLEGSADVVALLLLAKEREEGGLPKTMGELNALAEDAFGETLDSRLPLAFPPMLRTGLDTFVRASFNLPGLIVPGSWLESAANSSYADGPWAVWDQENAAGMPKMAADKAEARAPRLTTQLLYPVIKRAIARESKRDARVISADDRLDDLLGGQRFRLPDVLSTIAEELPNVEFDLESPSLVIPAQVRDLAHQLRDQARPREVEQKGLEPETRVPDWLMAMVRDRMDSDGSDYDPRTVARMANVPLVSVQRAEELVNRQYTVSTVSKNRSQKTS